MGRLKIFLTNLGKSNEGCLMGEWVKLPVPEDKLEAVKHRIGINERYEEYFITDYESSFLNLHISEYASISELNQFAEKVEELSDYDYEKLSAVLEMESSLSISEIIALIDELDNFDLLPDVHDDESLGEYYADCGCIFANVPDHIQRYFDYESYGRDIRLEGCGAFSSYGYVEDNR